MNEISSLGLILLLALLAGHLMQVVRMPEVTGYILAGVALGPSALGWVTFENLHALQALSEVALGLILFSIGSVFEYRLLLRSGMRILRLTLIESSLAAALVFAMMFVLGLPWQAALLLGAMAIETAPASTLMVIRECNGRGPLSDTLLGVIAINNILCLTAFSLAGTVIDLASASTRAEPLATALYVSIFPLFWQLLGSVALGFLTGLLLAGWARQVTEKGEMLILLAGSLLFCVGVARTLDLSSMVASLAVGATMVNLSARSRSLFRALSATDPPFYAIFFVIAGADLDLSLLGEIGLLGLGYVVARLTGKFIGSRIGARKAQLDPQVRRFLGFALMAQAGLAVGLMVVAQRRFPEYGDTITTIVLSAVTVFEMIGPISARFAIVRAGESAVNHAKSDSIWALG
jgi:Kef-type K+ transport system membrane component KefB